MECENDLEFERLKKISLILFPVLLIIGGGLYYFYKNSVDFLEIKIIDKRAEWAEVCTEVGCNEYELFYVTSESETLSTSEDIYSRLQVGDAYVVETKGWKFKSATRTLIRVYRHVL